VYRFPAFALVSSSQPPLGWLRQLRQHLVDAVEIDGGLEHARGSPPEFGFSRRHSVEDGLSGQRLVSGRAEPATPGASPGPESHPPGVEANRRQP
jgi:hypothetical protein